MVKLEPARWREWPGSSRLELWQAVILSFGFQPAPDLGSLATSGFNSSRARDAREFRRSRGYQPGLDLPIGFWDRLERCKTNVSTDGPIRPLDSVHQGMLTSPRCQVTLSEVVTFLVWAGFTLPSAMMMLMSPNDVPAEATPTLPTAEVAVPPAKWRQGAKKWTPELLQEMHVYRNTHGTKATGEHFQISGARVRQLLPGEKPKLKGYNAFNQRQN